MERSAELCERLRDALGPESLKTAAEDLLAYGDDAVEEGPRPSAVAFPVDSHQVAAAVAIARECGAALVARGAGTGRCGGTTVPEGGLLIALTRMNRVLALDVPNRRVRVQAGITLRALNLLLRERGLFFASDPASANVATLGGIVATNGGGPGTFAYGTAAAQVLAVELVLDDGTIVELTRDDVGYDLIGAVAGSEGTLGVVTALELRLLALPRCSRLAWATFAGVESAMNAALHALALRPVALEIANATVLRTIDAYARFGLRAESGALALVELAGEAGDVQARETELVNVFREQAAVSYHRAGDDAERFAVRTLMDGARGALGRLAPDATILDLCVPRSAAGEVCTSLERIAQNAAIPFGLLARGGEGVIHAMLLHDRGARTGAAVVRARAEMLERVRDLGGSMTAEYGVGSTKRADFTTWIGVQASGVLERVRESFAPSRTLNPETLLPSPAWP